MTVVLFSGAFINIYSKINEISKNEENEENLLIDASREDQLSPLACTLLNLSFIYNNHTHNNKIIIKTV